MYCYSLADIYVERYLPLDPQPITALGNDTFMGITHSPTIYVPGTGLSLYRATSPWNNYNICTLGMIFIPQEDEDSAYYTVATEDTALLEGTLYIPATYNDQPVKGIEDYGFYGCSNLTYVVIPDSVKTIGEYAFAYCCNIQDVQMSSGLTHIGNGAFMGCYNLNGIAIPDWVSYLGYNAFAECSNLSYVYFYGSQLTEISSSAFAYCYNLTQISLPTSLEYIDSYAFWDCGLTSLTIPASVTEIHQYAFYGCESLAGLTVASGNTAYRSESNCIIRKSDNVLVFGCNSSVIPTNSNITEIGEYAFFGMRGLTGITIPNNITTIGYATFYDCASLTGITIPGSVTYIGDSAFACSGLASITVPASVAYLGDSAFSYCSSLSNITFASGSQIDSIGSYMFNGCTNLTSIIIPNGVTEIGHSAFSYCNKLSQVTIPNSVISIGEAAFSNCGSLTNITIPASVESIAPYAFIHCSNLATVYVERYDANPWAAVPITTLGHNAFYGCNSALTIYVPNNAVSTYTSAWTSTSGWPYYAVIQAMFSPTSGLAYTLSNDGTYYTVAKGTANTSGVVYIPKTHNGKSVREIASDGFKNCTGLTGVVIQGNNLQVVGTSAFSGCDNITEIRIPQTVTGIGNNAFAGCSSLAVVYMERAALPVTTLGTNVFLSCSSLSKIYVPHNYHYYYNNNSSWSGYKTILSASFFPTPGLRYTLSQDQTYYSVSKGSANFSVNSNLYIPAEYSGLPVKKIAAYGFEGCSEISYVGFENSSAAPSRLTTVGAYAFLYCSNISNMYLPDETVTSIGEGAFMYCTRLYDFSMPNGVEVIEDYTFYGCNFSNFWIYENITSIGDYAFAYCSNLSYVSLPNSNLEHIGDFAFMFCGLRGFTIPYTVQSIGDFAFTSCWYLTGIVVERSALANYAPTCTNAGIAIFENCPLTGIYMPDAYSVPVYQQYANWDTYDWLIQFDMRSIYVESNVDYYESEVFTAEAYRVIPFEITFEDSGEKTIFFSARDGYAEIFDSMGNYIGYIYHGSYFMFYADAYEVYSVNVYSYGCCAPHTAQLVIINMPQANYCYNYSGTSATHHFDSRYYPMWQGIDFCPDVSGTYRISFTVDDPNIYVDTWFFGIFNDSWDYPVSSQFESEYLYMDVYLREWETSRVIFSMITQDYDPMTLTIELLS